MSKTIKNIFADILGVAIIIGIFIFISAAIHPYVNILAAFIISNSLIILTIILDILISILILIGVVLFILFLTMPEDLK